MKLYKNNFNLHKADVKCIDNILNLFNETEFIYPAKKKISRENFRKNSYKLGKAAFN